MKRRRLRLLLFVSTCLLLLSAAELSTRLLYAPARFGGDPALAAKYSPNRRLRYVSKEDGFDVRVRFNSLGMRDREHPRQKRPGVYRILVLGDSFMEAKQVELDEAFCAQLEAILSASREVEVMNTGHAGFGAAEQCLVLRHFGLERDPDLVVQAFFMNDVSDDVAVADRILWSAEGAPLRMRPVGPRSQFLRLLADRTRALPGLGRVRQVEPANLGDPAHDPFAILRPGAALRDESAWRRTLACLRESRRLADSIGADYLLLVIPLAQQVDPSLGGRVAEVWRLAESELSDLPQRRLAEFCAAQAIHRLDLLPLFREHPADALYFVHDGHWRPRGHGLAAEAAAGYIEDHFWRERATEND